MLQKSDAGKYRKNSLNAFDKLKKIIGNHDAMYGSSEDRCDGRLPLRSWNSLKIPCFQRCENQTRGTLSNKKTYCLHR